MDKASLYTLLVLPRIVGESAEFHRVLCILSISPLASRLPFLSRSHTLAHIAFFGMGGKKVGGGEEKLSDFNSHFFITDVFTKILLGLLRTFGIHDTIHDTNHHIKHVPAER